MDLWLLLGHPDSGVGKWREPAKSCQGGDGLEKIRQEKKRIRRTWSRKKRQPGVGKTGARKVKGNLNFTIVGEREKRKASISEKKKERGTLRISINVYQKAGHMPQLEGGMEKEHLFFEWGKGGDW